MSQENNTPALLCMLALAIIALSVLAPSVLRDRTVLIVENTEIVQTAEVR